MLPTLPTLPRLEHQLIIICLSSEGDFEYYLSSVRERPGVVVVHLPDVCEGKMLHWIRIQPNRVFWYLCGRKQFDEDAKKNFTIWHELVRMLIWFAFPLPDSGRGKGSLECRSKLFSSLIECYFIPNCQYKVQKVQKLPRLCMHFFWGSYWVSDTEIEVRYHLGKTMKMSFILMGGHLVIWWHLWGKAAIIVTGLEPQQGPAPQTGRAHTFLPVTHLIHRQESPSIGISLFQS